MDPQDTNSQKASVFQFLKSQQLAAISTITKDFLPEVAIVFYFIDDDWTIYVLTHNDSRKAENLRENHHVALAVGYELVPRTVQIEGTAEIVDQSYPEFEKIMDKFNQDNRLGLNPLFAAYKDHYVMLRITITWLRLLEFAQINNAETYTVLIPEEKK